MGGQISTPSIRVRKSKNPNNNNQSSSSFLENDMTDLLSADFLNEAVKECVDHALLDDASIYPLMKQRYEFYISCQRLPNMDSFSKTDACVYCYLVNENDTELIHCTEVIADDQDPNFARALPITFDTSTINKDIIFSVFDIDKFNQSGEHEREYIGSASVSILSILQSSPFHCSLRYEEKQSGEIKVHMKQQRRPVAKGTATIQRGQLKIRSYNCDQYSDKYVFQVDSLNIKSKDSIYLRVVSSKLKRKEGSNTDEWKDIPVYQPDVLFKAMKTIEWPSFEIEEKKIHDCLKFEIYTFSESSVRKDLIGEFKVSKAGITALQGQELPIRVPGRKSVAGQLKFHRAQLIMHPYTLVQYVYGGLNLQFLIGLDFSSEQTTAQGNQRQFLTIMTPEAVMTKHLHQYEQALNSCMDLVRFYSTNQMVPMYGIGGRLPPSFTHHSNCFAMSGDWYEPEIDISNKENAFEVYKNEVRRVKPSATLVFSDFLKFANNYCNEEEFTRAKQTMCVVLIFSYNELLESDVEETMAQLRMKTQVPMCVVNVCLGSMEYVAKLQESPNFHAICFENFRGDSNGFCNKIMKAVPKTCLDKTRSDKVPPILAFQNLQEARKHYTSSVRVGERKAFAAVDERPFFEYLTQDLGYKPELIREIFASGLEEEDVGLVSDRIGSYQKYVSYYKKPVRMGEGIYQGSNSESMEQKILRKARDFHRTKDKYNAHTKKQEIKTLGIKKEHTSQATSTFSFYATPAAATNYNDRMQSQQQQNERDEQQQSHQPQYQLVSQQQLQQHQQPFKSVNATIKRSEQPKSFMDKIKAAAKQKQNESEEDKETTIATDTVSCAFCDRSRIEVIVMPCGHNFCCSDSLKGLNVCPTCQNTIVQKIRFTDDNDNSYDSLIDPSDFHTQMQTALVDKRGKSLPKKHVPNNHDANSAANQPKIQLFVDVTEFQSTVSANHSRKKGKSNAHTIAPHHNH